MGLFDQLHLGLSGLRSHQYALEVTGDNIANVSTPGFSRRRLVLQHAPPLRVYPVGQLGGGVDAGPVVAVRSRFLEARHRLEASIASGEGTRHELLAGVEAIFVEANGFGFQNELSQFFNSFAQLSAQPESSAMRENVLGRAQNLIDRMQGADRRLDDTVRESNQRVQGLVSQVNARLSRIAELNERVARTEGMVPANAERDERAQVIQELSELMEVAVYENSDGTVGVTLRDGSALVIGSNAQTLQARSVVATGNVNVFLGSRDVTSLVGSGDIQGVIAVRDQSVPAYRRRLDELAYELMQRVNPLHQSGYALDGTTTGNAFFAPFTPPSPTDPTGATKALAVNSALVSNPSLIAAATTSGASGDGDQARAIGDLSRALVLNGGTSTFSDFYAQFVFELGSDVESARASAESAAAVAEHAKNQKLAVSAVSLDEEAVALIQFQRGYEASAKFIRIVDELTEVVMNIKR